MGAGDIISAVIVLFVLSIFFFSFFYIGGQFISSMESNSSINESSRVLEILSKSSSALNKLDYAFFMFFLGVILLTILTGWLVGGYFIFAVLYFAFIIFAIIMSIIFSNIWEQYTTNAIWGTTLTSMQLTNHILLYLPMYISIIGVLGLTVMFAKPFLMGGGRT